MYKILLTGASSKSFIGNALYTYLGELGYQTDDISKSEFMNEDFAKLDQAFAEQGINNKPIYSKPDIVIHCAWEREPDLHSTHHLEFAEMTCNFFDECSKRGIRVINLGSSSEYGVKHESMQEDMACNPHTTYGIAKLAVTLFAKKLGFNTLRLFAVQGKGGKNFASIVKEAKKWASPHDVRHYVDIKMVCRAVEKLMHAKHLYGEIINVASPIEGMQSNHTMAKRILQNQSINDFDKRWNTYPQRQYEPKMWQADTSRMTGLLNL